MSRILVSDESLSKLEKILSDSTGHYYENYKKLGELVSEITTGPLKGDLANSIKNKFEEKKDGFEQIGKAIKSATEGANAKHKEFNQMMSDVQSSMR